MSVWASFCELLLNSNEANCEFKGKVVSPSLHFHSLYICGHSEACFSGWSLGQVDRWVFCFCFFPQEDWGSVSVCCLYCALQVLASNCFRPVGLRNTILLGYQSQVLKRYVLCGFCMMASLGRAVVEWYLWAGCAHQCFRLERAFQNYSWQCHC